MSMNFKERLEYYIHCRRVGLELWKKVFERATKQDLQRCAQMLNMWQKPGTFVLESDYDVDVLSEFYCFNYKKDGKTAAQIYAEEVGPANADEALVLNGGLNSYSSLFVIEDLFPTEKTLFMSDLLQKDQDKFEFIDLSLSLSLPIGYVFYTRWVPLGEVNMLSGASLAFHPGFVRKFRRLSLPLKRKIKIKDKQIRRFLLFWQLYRKYGLPVKSEDIT